MVPSSNATTNASLPAPPPLQVSQELFDETVLENEDCFDLSPDEALRETIDQFRRQLGGGTDDDDDDDDDGGVDRASHHHVAPSVLSHLILSHPNSQSGRRERDERRQFADRLAFLDGFVMTDGTVRLSDREGDGDEDAGEAIIRTMDDIGRRCRFGYNNPCDRFHSRKDGDDDNDNFETDDDDDDNEGGVIAGGGGGGVVVGGGPFPNLIIFHRTSSIYTLMSFLGIIADPSSSSSSSYARPSRMAASELRVLSASARALSAILASDNRPNERIDDINERMCVGVRSELRDSFVPALGRLVCLVDGVVRAIDATAPHDDVVRSLLSSTLCDLLRLGTDATRGCEMAKVAWVRCVLPPIITNDTSNDVVDSDRGVARRAGGAYVVVSCLSMTTTTTTTMADEDARVLSMTEACILLASLCRYDDFRDVSGPGPKASSAHDHAVEFHRSGASTSLIGIANKAILGMMDGSSGGGGREGPDEGGGGQTTGAAANERLASAVLTALRVMAVNDEIIQTMVALGVLPIATDALRCVASDDGEDDDRVLARRRGFAAASLGLLRNLCGNDEIKTNLCLGSSTTTNMNNDRPSKFATPSALPHIIRAMQIYPSTALVQEHACGTFAAMALRRPLNARAILDADGPRFVILAMKRHVGNVNVQRQGALAVRNIVSRLLNDSPGDDARGDSNIYAGVELRSSIRDAFLELGAEDVLRNIAGQHQGSVDEAYAALRDLGCQVSLVKFNADDIGFSRTMMFGEKHNSSFRPVYEESAGLADGVDCAISQFDS
ncbi:hypothetical protein ACHAXA_003166 [Cyclostephanos tholiformis]|uniref:Uncharacterized protein n=1 Tax=Cyclostephanos tholiformis TaxID=382380 RepID=A0ABD3SS52_9STRA